MNDPFEGFDLEGAIVARASRAGLDLPAGTVAALAEHARTVLRANPILHLTSITEPGAFVERHLGESFEGAALLPPDIAGDLLDLGSGNGYPGLAVALARSGLRPVLAEASPKKAVFLEGVLRKLRPDGVVWNRQVQRPPDLGDLGPFRVITARAVGGWERILPRLAGTLAGDGHLLLWAGGEVETLLGRQAWRRYVLEARVPLPGRDRSWIWHFRPRRDR